MRSHGMGLGIHLLDFEPGDEASVREWMDQDYLVQGAEAPGICGLAAYESISGPPQFLSLFEADSVHSFYSEPFLALRNGGAAAGLKPDIRVLEDIQLYCSQIYPAHPVSEPACPTVDKAGLAPVVQLGRLHVPAEKIADFNAWYAQERAPQIEKVPGVRRIRRYVPVEGDPVLVVLYELEDESVLEHEDWKAAMATPWTDRVRAYYRQAPGSPGIFKRRGYAR